MEDNKELITSIIKELGIPANLTGYHYARCAIELMIDDINLMKSITGSLYPKIAQRFNTTVSRIERGIRTAIETGWSRANEDMTTQLFGYSISSEKGKPTNSEFIVTVADYIIMKLNHPTEKGGVQE